MVDYKRKISKKSVFIIIVLMYIVVEVLILTYLPMIPIRKCPDEIKQYYPLADTDSAYSVSLNIFGDVIFTNAYKADRNLKVNMEILLTILSYRRIFSHLVIKVKY